MLKKRLKIEPGPSNDTENSPPFPYFNKSKKRRKSEKSFNRTRQNKIKKTRKKKSKSHLITTSLPFSNNHFFSPFSVFWSIEEDHQLEYLVASIRTKPPRWKQISELMKSRTAKQCRERWINHIGWPVKGRKPWSHHEDWILFLLQKIFGNRWTEIKRLFAKRSENDIKNRWYGTKRLNSNKPMFEKVLRSLAPRLTNKFAKGIVKLEPGVSLDELEVNSSTCGHLVSKMTNFELFLAWVVINKTLEVENSSVLDHGVDLQKIRSFETLMMVKCSIKEFRDFSLQIEFDLSFNLLYSR